MSPKQFYNGVRSPQKTQRTGLVRSKGCKGIGRNKRGCKIQLLNVYMSFNIKTSLLGM